MPRLSLYRPNKGHDYKFFDRTMSEMFTVGGVDINLHKYLGPQTTGNVSASEPGHTGVTAIQDLLFLENRDRKYDSSVYTMRTLFRINDSDFDLTQFGLFLTGDTIFAVFHLNDMIECIGRKIMVGDVLEMPFLKDLYPLDDTISIALKRYFVVQDANRAAEGFAPTWYPHLWRVKIQPLVDSQEYKDILNNIDVNGDGIVDNTDRGLLGALSTYNTLLGINDAVVQRAEQDVPASGYDTSSIYTEALGGDGLPSDPHALDASQTHNTVNGSIVDASAGNTESSSKYVSSTDKVHGYLTGDGMAPNGATVAAGISFPSPARAGDFFLRLDYLPNRLFRYDGKRWVKIEDAVRTNLTPGDNNTTQLSEFINDYGKFMSNAVARDVIRVSSNYMPPANSATVSFALSSTIPYGTVQTTVPYVSTYGVRVKLDGLEIVNTMANINGNVGFTISTRLQTGHMLDYTVYAHVVNQRQSLSQALRPTADNI
jgi:hypothetical protein